MGFKLIIIKKERIQFYLRLIWCYMLKENHKVMYSFAFFFIRVSKETRAAGVLDNFAEGEKYTEHFLRKFVRNKSPEIMPSINSFFTDPSRSAWIKRTKWRYKLYTQVWLFAIGNCVKFGLSGFPWTLKYGWIIIWTWILYVG